MSTHDHVEPGSAPRASVVITTKNRKDDLRNAIRSCLAQSVAVEILVMDDASTDGTPEMVRREFPGVRLEQAEESVGYIVHRNRAARLAAAPVVFSLDDDAAFPSERTVEQTLGEFDHPRVGAVSIPRVDVNKPPIPLVLPPDDGRVHVIDSYVGCAHAVRRDVFNALGGYREFLFHQTEEMDYCARLYRAGYVVRCGRADAIHHYESPRRDHRRQWVHSFRNTLLYGWYNVPMPLLLPHWTMNHVNALRLSLRSGHAGWIGAGMWEGWKAIWHERGRRDPVPTGIYLLIRSLIRRRLVPLDEIEPSLPELARPSAA